MKNGYRRKIANVFSIVSGKNQIYVFTNLQCCYALIVETSACPVVKKMGEKIEFGLVMVS